MGANDMPKPAQFWLMKSEPDEVSIDDVLAAAKKTVPWFGVRNYQARNFMRDTMQPGDLAFFYHSSCAEPGIAGIVEIASPAYPDATQFDPASVYFDPKATQQQPRWSSVDVKAVRKTRLLSLKALRTYAALEGMQLLAKGSRLSIMPVEAAQWRFIDKLLAAG